MLLKTKILPALLLFLSALQIICTVFFVVRTTVNTWQIKGRLENSILQTITVPLNKITWVEKGEEVLIEGKLFDVKSFTINGDEIKFTGIFDTAEDQIAEDLNALEQDEDTSSPVCSLLAQLFCPAMLQQLNDSIAENEAFNNTPFPAMLTSFYNAPIIGITSPPPNYYSFCL